MDFLSQTFRFATYYYMVKTVFDSIGYDYYKGLKNKLPPIRYMGLDADNYELVILAHPKDFSRHLSIFKNSYDSFLQNQSNQDIRIADVKDQILEIYPSTHDLLNIPNGFIGLFVNSIGMEIVKSEFHKNEEVERIDFMPVTEDGINIENFNLCGVIETFIKKFNKKSVLKEKYKGLYLVVGEMKDINVVTGETTPTNKYNIFGGKRSYDETCVESTIRETREELGLIPKESRIFDLINILIPITKNIIRCSSFNVFCIYVSPITETSYNDFVKLNQTQLTQP